MPPCEELALGTSWLRVQVFATSPRDTQLSPWSAEAANVPPPGPALGQAPGAGPCGTYTHCRLQPSIQVPGQRPPRQPAPPLAIALQSKPYNNPS